jgi:cell division protein FtsN
MNKCLPLSSSSSTSTAFLKKKKKEILTQAAVGHAFNPRIQEVEAGRFLSSMPPWSTEWVPGQPGLYRETLSWKNQNQNQNQNQTKPNQTKPNQTKPNQTKPNKTKQNKTKQNKTKKKSWLLWLG